MGGKPRAAPPRLADTGRGGYPCRSSGGATALVAAQLRSDANLHEVELGFPPEPSREVVEALVADFSAAADAVVAVVDVGRAIRDALSNLLVDSSTSADCKKC